MVRGLFVQTVLSSGSATPVPLRMVKCTTEYIRKKYNGAVGVDSCQNDPVNALEWTDSLAKTHNQDSQEQIVLKNIHLLMLLKMVDCQK